MSSSTSGKTLALIVGRMRLGAKMSSAPYGGHRLPNVVLGRLRSDEFSALVPERQRAIDAFWGQIMSPARVDPDGTAAVLRSAHSK